MKVLLVIVTFLFSTTATAQINSNVDRVRLPQCENVADLERALSSLERMKGFIEDDDYKFLKGHKDRCGRYKIRSRSEYKLHSYHDAGDNIFTIYEVTGGKGYEGGKVVGYVANSIYSKDGWRIARGDQCALSAPGGECLVPRRCRAVTTKADVSYFQKLNLDEFVAPPYCYGVGGEP